MRNLSRMHLLPAVILRPPLISIAEKMPNHLKKRRQYVMHLQEMTSSMRLMLGSRPLKTADATKLGTLGFCMGGGFALLGACNNSEVSFCVDYYGQIENVDESANLKGPVLLLLGSEDPRITPWASSTFLPAATKYKKRVEVQLYPGAKHAFHNKWGANYNESAACGRLGKNNRVPFPIEVVETPTLAM